MACNDHSEGMSCLSYKAKMLMAATQLQSCQYGSHDVLLPNVGRGLVPVQAEKSPLSCSCVLRVADRLRVPPMRRHCIERGIFTLLSVALLAPMRDDRPMTTEAAAAAVWRGHKGWKDGHDRTQHNQAPPPPPSPSSGGLGRGAYPFAFLHSGATRMSCS